MENKKLLRISERLEKVAVQLELSFDAMLEEGDIDPRTFSDSVKSGRRRNEIPFYTMSSDLAGIVKRLEVVTSRLEAVAGSGGSGGSADVSVAEDSGSGVKESVGRSAGGKKDVQVVLTPQVEKALAPFVKEYDEILSGVFAKVVSLSQEIGGDLSKQVVMVKEAFQAQREFIVQVAKCKEPSQDVLQKMLQPTAVCLTAVQSFREGNRASQQFNHLSAFSEAIPALGWVTMKIPEANDPMNPKPAPYVKEMKDAGMFYTNRVLKDFKDKDQRHVEWAKAWIQTLMKLHDYVKQHHTTGLSWNKAGAPATAGTSPPPTKGAAPPPPPPGPPPPPPPPPADLTSGSGGGDDMSAAKSALFADLNKGTEITKGLKKVTADMQTHKNPNLRQTGPVTYKPGSGPKPYSKPTTTTTPAPKLQLEGGKKWSVPAKENPPVLELNGKKWNVEYQKDRKDLAITEANMRQTVYVYKCENITLQIKGKVNSITLDSCKKVALVFDDVIAAVDFINCQRIQAQVIGKTPIFNVDKTDGCQIYLSKNSLDTEVVGAKYSELNILVPDESGEFTEFAIAEQFKTVWDPKTKKMNTVPTEVVG
ncbi:adenylyl cyclase-associated protein 1-like isoform X2 [Branchiostoma floridae]|uniref:Adenylyl cyclase-associated protein n=1 Tax=Branchiostoma floridae TaxID=7739 RepID=A0A9J7HKA0_BRAFL|nr:adenylyl cyclase-associated protein 1-like isoform X2 [Branchiostoma floridae]